MSRRRRAFLEAGEHLALAPFDAGRWLRALDALTAATGTRAGQFMGWNGPGELPFNFTTELSPEDMRYWLELGGADPRANPIIRAGMTVPVMKDVADPEIVSEEVRRRNPLWGEFYDPIDIPHICFTPLWREGSAHLVLTALSSANQGPVGGQERELFRALAKQWRAAALFSRAMKNEGARALSGGLEAASIAAVVVNGFGCVMTMTAKAEELVAQGNPLRVKDGALETCSHSGNAALQAAIRRSSESFTPQSIPVDGQGGRQIIVRVATLPRDQTDIGFGARVMVLIEEPPANSPLALMRRFSLSKAESETAALLIEGLSLEEIAFRRGVARETIRSQAKAVYAKADVRGQVGLMARILARYAG